MKKIIILLCVLWMGFIFYNSNNSGEVSEKMSSKVTTFVQNQSKSKALTKVNKMNFDKLNYIVRKNAHAFEYTILAILVSNALFVFNNKGKGAIIYVLFIGLFYAVTDEFHQLFIKGRTSLVGDVLIDFIGTIVGVTLYYLVYYNVYQKHFVKIKK